MNGFKRLIALLISVGVLASTAGCGKFMGGLRRDLDDDPYRDSPTVGGQWSERGFLDEEEETPSGYRAIGHGERSPASADTSASNGEHDSWVTPERAEGNRRDFYRGRELAEEERLSSGNTPNLAPAVKRKYKNGARATKADFVDESPNEGSLWSTDGQTNYYFTKNKVRGVGDLVTIKMENEIISDVALEVKRTLTERERDHEMKLAQERIRAQTLGLPGPDVEEGKDVASAAQAAPQRDPAAAADADKKKDDVEIRKATYGDINVGKAIALKAGDNVMAEILERYPNGNYKIRGTKKVLYKGGLPRLVSIVAVVRGADIAEDDTVPSGKLYEYRLEAIQ